MYIQSIDKSHIVWYTLDTMRKAFIENVGGTLCEEEVAINRVADDGGGGGTPAGPYVFWSPRCFSCSIKDLPMDIP
jgi:hypothetical protein